MELFECEIPKELIGLPRFKCLKHMYSCVHNGIIYWISLSEIDKYTHIRIIREDKKPIHNYMDLQTIKNTLIGVNKTAIQIFPRVEDMVDFGNTYHLWSWDGMEAPNLKDLYNYLEA